MLNGNIPLAACTSVRLVRPTCILPALQPICHFRHVVRPGRMSVRVYVPAFWLTKGISAEVKPATDLQRKKDKSEGTTVVKSEPHSVEPASGAQQRPLLSEERLTNKEQRKADWTIMKEMAGYLWPKVSSPSNWINVYGN